jgi:hypothetical protein
MLFDCVVVVLLAKFGVCLAGWLKLWPLPSLGAKLDLAVAFRRAEAQYCLGASIEDKQVPLERLRHTASRSAFATVSSASQTKTGM